MRSLIIPFVFLLMPIAEIATFIIVGREVGVGITLLLVLGSAIAGAVLLRIQGFGVLRKIQEASQTGTDPGRQLVHGVMIVIAAFLLIIPGFISDIAGLLLFIPAVRDFGWSFVKNRLTIVTTGMGTGRGFSRRPEPDPNGPRRAGPRVIDLDDDDYSRTDGRGRTDPNERDRLK
ncbi:FxsA family protein [Pararhizobium qamdonense]|uniref:FxsA family protein n=1 Tax=Pararhizobium qamdonense TaxID=3031126 RepID=UPI0023E1EB42|nr:FxsA family protein [Pararhizobium qamdonense]